MKYINVEETANDACKTRGVLGETRYFPETRKMQIFWEVIDALEYCHQLTPKLVHRDVKPANIILDANMHAKLGDFGLSCYLEGDELAHEPCGTVMYLSPEMVKNAGYDEKSDMWSIGCILYELMVYHQPFDAFDPDTEITDYQLKKIQRSITLGRYESIAHRVSRTIQYMITSLLNQLSKSRPSCTELKEECKARSVMEAAKKEREAKKEELSTPATKKDDSTRLPLLVSEIDTLRFKRPSNIKQQVNRAAPTPASSTKTPSLESSSLTPTAPRSRRESQQALNHNHDNHYTRRMNNDDKLLEKAPQSKLPPNSFMSSLSFASSSLTPTPPATRRDSQQAQNAQIATTRTQNIDTIRRTIKLKIISNSRTSTMEHSSDASTAPSRANSRKMPTRMKKRSKEASTTPEERVSQDRQSIPMINEKPFPRPVVENVVAKWENAKTEWSELLHAPSGDVRKKRSVGHAGSALAATSSNQVAPIKRDTALSNRASLGSVPSQDLALQDIYNVNKNSTGKKRPTNMSQAAGDRIRMTPQIKPGYATLLKLK